jgi:cyclic pyranopterin monophosphate synthase
MGAGVSLTHIDSAGRARMVDVSAKPPSRRTALAAARVRISPELAAAIAANSLAKGDLLAVARLAGIQAAKRTDELIPLCHTLPLEHVDVEATLVDLAVEIRATAVVTSRTGVEMEALTAAAVAALTVIDMGKAIDPAMVIENVRLLEKTGGRRGVVRPHEKESPR